MTEFGLDLLGLVRPNRPWEENCRKVCLFAKKHVILHPLIVMERITYLLLTNYKNIVRLMNQYETVFILTPVLSDEQMKETVAKFEKVLTDNGAEILNKEAWGLKKLAYNIEKKTSGFYSLVEFKAEPTVIAKLETAYRRDEKVIRYMTVKLDKYAVAYAEKRRAKLGKKEEA